MIDDLVNEWDSLPVHVMGTGELYDVHKVHKMIRKFRKMNWTSQQSFLLGLAELENVIKDPPKNYEQTYTLTKKA